MWRHEVGTPSGDDVLVIDEPDQRFELTLDGSRSGELAIVTAASRITTEVRVISMRRPLDEPVVVRTRERGTEYRLDHARGGAHGDDDGDGTLYLVTNSGAEEFTLMRAASRPGARRPWTPVQCAAIAPARDDTRLLRCDVLADHLVLTVRRDGEQLLVITDHDGGNVREIRARSDRGHDQGRARRGLRPRLGDHRRGIPDRAARLVSARPRRPGHGTCSSDSRSPVMTRLST